MALKELNTMPVGYLEDVMLFHDFASAWATFKDSEDQEKLATTHPLYEVCREIWYEQKVKRKKKKQP